MRGFGAQRLQVQGGIEAGFGDPCWATETFAAPLVNTLGAVVLLSSIPWLSARYVFHFYTSRCVRMREMTIDWCP